MTSYFFRTRIGFIIFSVLIPALSGCDQEKHGGLQLQQHEQLISLENEHLTFNYDLRTLTFQVIDKRKQDTCIRRGTFAVNQEKFLSEDAVSVEWSQLSNKDVENKALEIAIRQNDISHILQVSLSVDTDYLVFKLGLENHGYKRYRIHTLAPLIAQVFPNTPYQQHFMLDGNSGKIPTKVRNEDALTCNNNILLTLRQDSSLRSMVAGGLQYRDFDRFASVTKKSAGFELRVWSEDPVGKAVEAGQKYIPADNVYLGLIRDNPLDALETYGKALKKIQENKLGIYDFPTVCLWYNDFYGKRSHGNHSVGAVREMQTIRESGFLDYSRAAVRLVPDMYALNNQQGWWSDKDWQKRNIFNHRGRSHPSGHYRQPYETTPKWAREVINLGGLPFTYIQPGMRSDDYAEAYPEHMLFNHAAAPVTDELGDTLYYSDRHWQKFKRGVMKKHSYDYTDSGFVRHLNAVYKHLDTSGIKGLMYDFPDMARAEQGGMDDAFATTARAYRIIFETARDALGPAAFLHERNIKYGSDLTLGVVSSHRIMGDNDKINPTLTRRGGLRWYKNRVVINYDMDAKNLYVTSPANRDGQRAMLTMTYVTSGRFLLANSFATIAEDPALFRDLTRIFPFHSLTKSARPIDAFMGKVVPEIFDLEIDSSWHQLTLYNAKLDKGSWPEWGKTFHLPDGGKQIAAELKVDLSGEPGFGGMGLDPHKTYHLYDFWNDRYIGQLDGSNELTQLLRPGEARVISVHEVRDYPQFISTNRHIMQGLVDLRQKPAWDAAGLTLSGISNVVKGDLYEIIIATNGFEPDIKITENENARMKIQEIGADLIRVSIESRITGPITWQVAFDEKAVTD